MCVCVCACFHCLKEPFRSSCSSLATTQSSWNQVWQTDDTSSHMLFRVLEMTVPSRTELFLIQRFSFNWRLVIITKAICFQAYDKACRFSEPAMGDCCRKKQFDRYEKRKRERGQMRYREIDKEVHEKKEERVVVWVFMLARVFVCVQVLCVCVNVCLWGVGIGGWERKLFLALLPQLPYQPHLS